MGGVEKIGEFIRQVKDKNSGVKLMGFGHRVYKNYDPRAKLMRETCHEVLDALGLHDDPLFKLAMALEKIALEDEYFVARKLYPNVDFYSGIVQRAIGIPVSLFTAIFALARTVGWIAQLNEMIGDPEYKIGRPRQLYAGATTARRQADRSARADAQEFSPPTALIAGWRSGRLGDTSVANRLRTAKSLGVHRRSEDLRIARSIGLSGGSPCLCVVPPPRPCSRCRGRRARAAGRSHQRGLQQRRRRSRAAAGSSPTRAFRSGSTGWFQGDQTQSSRARRPGTAYIAANFNNAGPGGTHRQLADLADLLDPGRGIGELLGARRRWTPDFADQLRLGFSKGGSNFADFALGRSADDRRRLDPVRSTSPPREPERPAASRSSTRARPTCRTTSASTRST